MSVITALKAAAETALALVKANPVVAVGVAVGSVAVGYGGYKGVKYLRNRPAKQTPGVNAVIAANEAVATAAPIAPPAISVEQQELQATHALLTMSRAEAEEAGLLTEWNTALKAKLRAKK